MRNRDTLKKSRDENGNERFTAELVKKYLLLDGEKQFGEIKKYLVEQGITYHDDSGLVKVLERLRKKNEIGKHLVYGKSYPRYYTKTKGLGDIIATAQEFQRKVIHGIAEIYPKHESKTDVTGLIQTLVHIYGLYNLYVQIKSWEFTDKQKVHKVNFDTRGAWLKNTLPLGNESRLLEDGIMDLINDQDFSKIYEDGKKQKKILEMEQSLRRSYPSAMKFLDKEFEDSKLRHKQRVKK